MKKTHFLKIICFALSTCYIFFSGVGCGKEPYENNSQNSSSLIGGSVDDKGLYGNNGQNYFDAVGSVDDNGAHVHNYNQCVVASEYWAGDATCEEGEKYYYSCRCGKKGYETFEQGVGIGHSRGEWMYMDDLEHMAVCVNCGDYIFRSSHSGGSATCKELAECNLCHEQYGDFESHKYSSNYMFDETHHWKTTTCGCAVKEEYKEHTFNNLGVCEVCKKSLPPTEGVLYSLSSDGTYAEVIAYTGDKKIIKIADNYHGVPVKVIYKKAFYNSEITGIVLPEGITEIGEFAFSGSKLRSITIPKSISVIGYYAFSFTYDLKKVYLPSIADWCDITITSAFGTGIYDHAEELYFDGKLFNGKLEIPNTVNSICHDLFSGCNLLTDVLISENLKSVGSGAFSFCDNLTNVIIGDDAEIIESSAFVSCKNLRSVVIGKNVKKIAQYAFDECSKLDSVVFRTPTGWEVDGVKMDEKLLMNPQTAASELRALKLAFVGGKPVHYGKVWTRN